MACEIVVAIRTCRINYHAKEISLLFYPNPAKHTVHLHTANVLPEASKVHVYNMNGKRVLVQSVNQRSSTVNVQNLRPGLYLFHLYEKEKFVSSQKVVLN